MRFTDIYSSICSPTRLPHRKDIPDAICRRQGISSVIAVATAARFTRVSPKKGDGVSRTLNKRKAPLPDRSEITDTAEVFKLPDKQRQLQGLRLDSIW